MNPHLHPDEQKLRIELAACYRVFALLGWTEMIYSHITVRLPETVSGTLQGGLQQTNFYSAQLHGMVAYHDFEGITIHAEEAPRLLRSIGQCRAVILRNHGLLAWGETLSQCFSILWTLQRACEIQLATLSMGPAIPIPEPVAQKCARDALQFAPRLDAGQDMLGAMIRQVDRQDASYRL